MGATRRPKQTEDQRWPLGDFLRTARGNMSIRAAAKRAELSESRWRQVEAGVQKMAGGIEVPVHPRAETIAAMCRAINADVAQGLQLAGHNPADYAWLLETSASTSSAESLEWFAGLTRAEREDVLAKLQRLHLDTELGASRPRKGRAV